MNERDFTYWLKGFFELSEAKTLTEKQVLIIKDHLNLVFNKVTPERKERNTQVALDKLKEAFKEKNILKDVKICSSKTEQMVDPNKISEEAVKKLHDSLEQVVVPSFVVDHDAPLDTKTYCSHVPTADEKVCIGDPEPAESASTLPTAARWVKLAGIKNKTEDCETLKNAFMEEVKEKTNSIIDEIELKKKLKEICKDTSNNPILEALEDTLQYEIMENRYEPLSKKEMLSICGVISKDEVEIDKLKEHVENINKNLKKQKTKLATDMPAANTVSPEEMKKARAEATEIRKNLDKKTKGMGSIN